MKMKEFLLVRLQFYKSQDFKLLWKIPLEEECGERSTALAGTQQEPKSMDAHSVRPFIQHSVGVGPALSAGIMGGGDEHMCKNYSYTGTKGPTSPISVLKSQDMVLSKGDGRVGLHFVEICGPL